MTLSPTLRGGFDLSTGGEDSRSGGSLPRSEAGEVSGSGVRGVTPRERLPIFCDWLSCAVPVENVPTWFDTWIESRTDSNCLQWRRPAWTEFRDSHTSSSSTKIQVRHDRESGRLKIDGNLGRFGRTDNVWGRSTYAAGACFIDLLAARHGVRQTGHVSLSRVDLTMNIAFASAGDAYDWLRWSQTVKLGRTSATPYPTGTAWKTRRWYAKAYDKIADLKRHKMQALANTLEAEVGYLLRLELTLRTNELAHAGADYLHNWIEEEETMNVIFTERFKPLLEGRGATVDELSRGLPVRLSNALEAWRNGRDFHQAIADGRMSRRTFYRLRKELMGHGVDISVPCNVTTLNIRPRDISPVPVAAPDWYRQAA